MNDTQPPPISDFEQIKSDLKNLYEHVSVALQKKTERVQIKWNEMRITLETKRDALEAQAAQLIKAGSAASSEMQNGFSAALTELKKSFVEAKSKFGSEQEKQR